MLDLAKFVKHQELFARIKADKMRHIVKYYTNVEARQ